MLHQRQKYTKPMILWSVTTLFFAFQFILRLSAGILREEIMHRFSIDTLSFGTLAGYYYLGYAGMQIPFGIMLDRLNFKLVTSSAILLSVIGTTTFVLADSWNLVLLGRFLIGAGSGVGFLAVAKVIKLFFAEKYHAFMIGFAFTFGLIGAVFGGTPMKIIFEEVGYDLTFICLALVGIFIAILLLFAPSPKLQNAQYSSSVNFTQIRKLFFHPIIISTGIGGGLLVGPLEGFADVWAMPFFQHIHNFSINDSIFVSSLVFFGMCCGGPLLAYFAKLLDSNIAIIVLCGICTIAVFSIILFSNLSFIGACVLMFILGILCCYQVLVFAFASNLVEKSQTGIAIAIINCINMSFGHFFHKVISVNMNYYWSGLTTNSGFPIYSQTDFLYGLGIIPLGCFVGVIIFLVVQLKSKKI